MRQTKNFNINVPELGDTPDITQVSDAIQSLEDALSGTLEVMNASIQGNKVTLTSGSRTTKRTKYYDGMAIKFVAPIQIAPNTITLATVDNLSNQPIEIPFLVNAGDSIDVIYKGNKFTATITAVQRSNSVTSSSTTTVATSQAVKTAYDKGVEGLNTANSKVSKAGDTMTGALRVPYVHIPNSGRVYFEGNDGNKFTIEKNTNNYTVFANFNSSNQWTKDLFVISPNGNDFRINGGLTALKFLGPLQGNADTATKLQTPRTMSVGNTSKYFDGSSNVGWSLDEIGAVNKSGDTIKKLGVYDYKRLVVPEIVSQFSITGDEKVADTIAVEFVNGWNNSMTSFDLIVRSYVHSNANATIRFNGYPYAQGKSWANTCAYVTGYNSGTVKVYTTTHTNGNPLVYFHFSGSKLDYCNCMLINSLESAPNKYNIYAIQGTAGTLVKTAHTYSTVYKPTLSDIGSGTFSGNMTSSGNVVAYGNQSVLTGMSYTSSVERTRGEGASVLEFGSGIIVTAVTYYEHTNVCTQRTRQIQVRQNSGWVTVGY